MSRRVFIKLSAPGLVICLLTLTATGAENTTGSEVDPDTAGEKGTIVWAPIPMLQPALGGGLIMLGTYFHPSKPGETASISGVAAGYTSTDSYVLVGGHDHHYEGGRWRLRGMGGTAKFNLNFNGIGAEAGDPGRSLSYSIEGSFIDAALFRKFSRGWSAGLKAQLLDSEVNFDDGEPGDPILDGVVSEALDLTSYGVGVIAQKDTRDNRFAPHTGQRLELSGTLFPSNLGNDLDYRIYSAFYSHYIPIRDDTVLAANVSTGYADGEVPFYRLSKLNIRGVSGDTYWDKFLLQAQAEVRHTLAGNWGMAIFAGYGGVSPSLGDLDSDKMIFAAGAGIRYTVSREQRVALRLDVAEGQDGTMVYISVGEAF